MLSYLTIGCGRPVILLHGLLANAQVNWFDTGVAARIAATGRQVIAPDFRGHGQSDKPAQASAYPPDILARDQEDLIRHLRARNYDLAGYSLGSRMCVRLLARGARPAHLVLGGMGLSGIVDVDARRLAFEDYVANGPRARDPRIGSVVQAMMARFGVSRASILGVLRQQLSTSPNVLGAITAETLILCGSEDQDNGRATELAQAIPNAALQLVPGTHLSAIGSPAFADALVRFLAPQPRS